MTGKSSVRQPRPGAMSVDDFENELRAADPGMRRLAFRLVGSAVDDVLQVAYASAFRGLAAFEGRAQFQTWLYRIVYNNCLNHTRKQESSAVRRCVGTGEAGEIVEPGPGPAWQASTRVDLGAALDKLSPEQRAAVLLVDAEELTFEQAAAVLQVSLGTVASRVSRARRHLRTTLSEGERA